MEERKYISRYWFFPKGSKTPVSQKKKEKYSECFTIPKLDKDIEAVCCSRTNICFIELNRGYKCKKHEQSI